MQFFSMCVLTYHSAVGVKNQCEVFLLAFCLFLGFLSFNAKSIVANPMVMISLIE